MKLKTLLFYSIAIITLFTIYSCAQRKSPTGGPKDLLGPQMVSTTPANKSLNFKGNKIIFQFNEYVKDDNITDKIIISPALDSTFKYKIIKKTLTIELEKLLKTSKTYTINLGDAIKDITEGNIGKNLSLTFSTGDILDTASISGEVIDIRSGSGIKDMIVGLYNSSDTLTLFNSKPAYLTKTNELGKFKLENLPPGNFLLSSITDPDRNLKYTNQNEYVGFISDTLKLEDKIDNIKIAVQKFDLRPLKVLNASSQKENVEVGLNKGVSALNITFADDTTQNNLFTLDKEANLATLYPTRKSTDSISIRVTAIDSFNIKVDTTFKILFKKAEEVKKRKSDKEKRNTFNISVLPQDNIRSTDEVKVFFDLPILTKNYKQIYFSRDSLTRYELVEKDFIWDKNQTSFQITKKIPFDTILFTVEYGALLNIKGDTNILKSDRYLKKNPDNFATIGGTVDIKSPTFIVQLRKKDSDEVYEIKNKKEFRFDYLEPGTYSLRVLVDENGNGKWDRGDLLKRIEPEKIIYFKIKDKKGQDISDLSIKANWEMNDNLITDK